MKTCLKSLIFAMIQFLEMNASLIARIEELNACNVSTSIVEHVTICTRRRDVNIDAINDRVVMIKEKMIT
jgi:hypothetical protein